MLATLRASLFGEEGAAEGLTGLFGLGDKDESPADQFASWLPSVARGACGVPGLAPAVRR